MCKRYYYYYYCYCYYCCCCCCYYSTSSSSSTSTTTTTTSTSTTTTSTTIQVEESVSKQRTCAELEFTGINLLLQLDMHRVQIHSVGTHRPLARESLHCQPWRWISASARGAFRGWLLADHISSTNSNQVPQCQRTAQVRKPRLSTILKLKNKNKQTRATRTRTRTTTTKIVFQKERRNRSALIAKE